MKLEDIGFYTLSEERAKNCHKPDRKLQRCEMIVTPRCNFKCPYCRGVDLPRDITYAEAVATLKLWSKHQLYAVRFSGGEPTLHPQLPQICYKAKQFGCKKIAVSTNGSASKECYNNLLTAGVNDFSISLDACCSSSGKKMCGVEGMWEKVLESIEYLSTKTYVSVGLVVTPTNLSEVAGTVKLAHQLGVKDIRVIPAAQYGKSMKLNIDKEVLVAHPILNYRSNNFASDIPVRGLTADSCKRCWLVRDDMAVMNGEHYPCIIYMRERGKAIGKVGPDMMKERAKWAETHDCLSDTICKNNCLDVCRQYNIQADVYHSKDKS